MEFQIKDRLSFKRFLGFGAEKRIPDEKTIWLYREILAKGGFIKPQFERFETHFQEAGYRKKTNRSRTAKRPPHFRKTRKVLRQKDLDARWTKKRGETFYGYKDHFSVDVKHKLIRRYTVTAAHFHDSVELEKLLDPWITRGVVYGDSAYLSMEQEEKLGRLGYWFRFNQKGYRGNPLTDGQKRRKRMKSRIRARVEHVFEWMECKTGGTLTRGVGQVRVEAKIGLRNLVYILSRFAYLEVATCGEIRPGQAPGRKWASRGEVVRSEPMKKSILKGTSGLR